MNKLRDTTFLSYLFTIILWGSAFPMIKIALNDFSAESLSAFRLILATIILLPFVIIKKLPTPELRDIPVIFILGFCGFVIYHTALNFGETLISAGISGILVSTTPIFSSALAYIFLKEHFSKWNWLSSLVAFIGISIISISKDDYTTINVLGVFIILLASFSESLYFTFQKKYIEKYGFIAFTLYTIMASSPFMLIFIPEIINDIHGATFTSIVSVLYLAIFPTIIPYVLLAYIVKSVGVSDATMSLYLTPIVSLLLSYLLLDELPTTLAIIGGIITLLSVSLSNFFQNT
ncbi:DMT family transporter [Staphylococcus aureus]|uniref:DMT family transporter n=1 Tax=Staphylococcus aureus TaxID=1280 RepID=UPI000E067237|nr:DMT family transporter [Staphylococcus aureus]SUK20264.1 Transporter, drug/metabolite exporter family protein [Staphylococcus aureus]SUK93920.1 Transporter, drug/metabolite exporter family protein [Staphylococcus aureus]SUL05956.1 Transporter, drug/metabolite exporter family protein [Staphylococcus aureus]SUL07621.1 Transporter, drug/metabolite exporter family protein [Staphylococcus aureus]SUL83031.1 Transporter, drug/metabolite exporter family protein [Staphylococcus aureus]